MIDLNTRRLKLLPNGAFVAGPGKLCDHCGRNQVCNIRPAEQCLTFLPTLGFADSEGMTSVFNTVRLGRAWHTRLRRGQPVALWHTKQKQIFGYARVLTTFAGSIKQMLADHAHANHLMVKGDPDDAAERLYSWQRRNYGPRIVHEGSSATIVYLLRTRSEDAPTDYPGQEAGWPSEGDFEGPWEDRSI